MKVYIKPWAEALKEAQKHEGLVDVFPDGHTFIMGVPRRFNADWGLIRTAEKRGNNYTVICHGHEGFTYDKCCVEEITPEWLEKNAEVFSEKKIIILFDNWYNDKHRIVIYKCHDHLDTFFFYVEWFYLDSTGEELKGWRVEKFIEIK